MKQKPPVRHRENGPDTPGLLWGIALGFCCSSAAFLALWPAISTLSQAPPITTIAEEGGTVIPQGGSRPTQKLYTDRIEPDTDKIEPAMAAVSQEKRALGTQERLTGRKARPRGCQPGRTRNNLGQCGRWPAKAFRPTAPIQKVDRYR
ncbi:MAG: hypothetical protein H7X89_04805 [Rhizobiales bacterium]|nr:hypothetical protein [Hyphomicrobiales bacterium]